MLNKKSYTLILVLVIASIVTACGGPVGSSLATQASLTAGAIVATAQTTNAKTASELNAANAAIAALIALVNKYVASDDITGNAENGLLAKLDGIQDKVTRGDTTPAVNQLQAFINEVEAQRGKKITETAANDLIAKAQAIIAMLKQPAALLPASTPAPTLTPTPKPTP